MSKIALSGDASGTGTFTIASPNSNSNFTLTLPTNSGTLLTTSSTGQVIPRAALPAGSVLQVVNATGQNGASNSTQTFADTGLSATITPTSASSKVLVLIHHASFRVASGSANGIKVQLYRNGTAIKVLAYELLYSSVGFDVAIDANYLDSPATTSAVTYKTQFALLSSASSVAQVNPNSPDWSITLLEIAA